MSENPENNSSEIKSEPAIDLGQFINPIDRTLRTVTITIKDLPGGRFSYQYSVDPPIEDNGQRIASAAVQLAAHFSDAVNQANKMGEISNN